MKKRKLRNFILPTLYVLIIAVSFFSISALNNILIGSKDENNPNYVKSLMKDATQATLKETEEVEPIIFKPYVGDEVNLSVSYYDKDDAEEKQVKSLILYENTYMPSTGIMYESNKDFDVVSVLEGEVKSIKEDEILGTVIEISHNPNLTTYYYSLKNIKVKEKDKVLPGSILGQGNSNKIKSDANILFFEVYYGGKSLNPEKFYEMKVDELQ